MGCFDTIRIRCPRCGAEIACQSKSGDCSFNDMTLEEALEEKDPAIFDINRHSPHVCPECGCKCHVVISYRCKIEELEE